MFLLSRLNIVAICGESLRLINGFEGEKVPRRRTVLKQMAGEWASEDDGGGVDVNGREVMIERKVRGCRGFSMIVTSAKFHLISVPIAQKSIPPKVDRKYKNLYQKSTLSSSRIKSISSLNKTKIDRQERTFWTFTHSMLADSACPNHN